MSGEGYRPFEHTADLGLEVWAETPERLYALAATALMAQIAVPRGGRSLPSEVRVERSLEGDDAGDLLVHWLNTVLLESELNRALWTWAMVDRLSARSLRGVLEGPRLDSARLELLREIKAVSHHALELELEPPRCRCRLVLDL